MRKLMALSLLLLTLSACALFPNRDPVNITVVGIEPLQSQDLEVRFAVKLRVQNPNETAIDYNGVALDLDVNGRPLASGVSDQIRLHPTFFRDGSDDTGERFCVHCVTPDPGPEPNPKPEQLALRATRQTGRWPVWHDAFCRPWHLGPAKHCHLVNAMQPTLYTERLILRPLTLDDAEATQQQFPRWEVVRYLNAVVPWPYPADGARSYLEHVALPAMARGKEWHWSIRLKSAPEVLIGNVCLSDTVDDNRGFWLGPQWQGLGLMTEASAAVTDYWFGVLERPVLRVPKAAPNLGSRRISEREGMRLIRTDEGQFVEGTFPRDIWEMTREEWLELKSPSR